MKQKNIHIWFLLPGIILYSLFVVYPIFSAARISLYEWNGIGEMTFVGFDNYKSLFFNPVLLNQLTNALKNSLTIFILSMLINTPLQIIYAYMIYSKTRGASKLQTILFSPQFISTPVIVFLFTLLLDGNIGLFNNIFEKIGLSHLSQPWLGMPSVAIYVVWFMISWAGFGVGMMYLIAAMNMISIDNIEAAYMEGAGYWRRLFLIVLPQIKTTVFNLILISYITSMTIFDYSYILGGISGGVNGSVDVVSLFFYRIAFGDNNPLGGNLSQNSMGMGTTIAVVLFVLIFFVAALQLYLTLKGKEKAK